MRSFAGRLGVRQIGVTARRSFLPRAIWPRRNWLAGTLPGLFSNAARDVVRDALLASVLALPGKTGYYLFIITVAF